MCVLVAAIREPHARDSDDSPQLHPPAATITLAIGVDVGGVGVGRASSCREVNPRVAAVAGCPSTFFFDSSCLFSYLRLIYIYGQESLEGGG